MDRGEMSERQFWELLGMLDELIRFRIQEAADRGALFPLPVRVPPPERPARLRHLSDEDMALEMPDPPPGEVRN